MEADARRVYYDHEPMYRRLLAEGQREWNPAQNVHAFDHLVAFLESEYAPEPGRALELGCGGAQASMILARRGWCAFATDFSATAVRMAMENVRSDGFRVCPFVADSARPLPIAPESVSLVVDNHVLHCLVEKADRAAFLANAYRALRPGGMFFSTNMSCEGRVDYERFNIDPVTRVTRDGTRFFASRAELIEEFEAAGFELAFIDFVEDEGDAATGKDAVIYACRA